MWYYFYFHVRLSIKVCEIIFIVHVRFSLVFIWDYIYYMIFIIHERLLRACSVRRRILAKGRNSVGLPEITRYFTIFDFRESDGLKMALILGGRGYTEATDWPAVYEILTGVTVAPRARVPKYTMGYSGQLGSATATTSPLPTPSFLSMPDQRAMRSSNCA